MKPLYEEEAWDITVEWTRPKSYERLLEEGSDNDEHANLYLISGRYSGAERKILYIGKTWMQFVSTRLSQPDHKKRYASFAEEHPRHKFSVSHGIITINNGNLTEKRLDDVESILIFTNQSEHAINLKSIYEHGVYGSYRITNTGYKHSLPKQIYLGLFVY